MAPSRAEQILWLTSGILVALFAVSLVLHFVDARTIGRAGVWEKPMKFQLSLAVHLASLAVAVRFLSEPWRNGWIVLVAAAACIAATAFEIFYIMVQAARQQASHFNLSTPFYATMYSLMAAGAVVISLAAGVVGLAMLLDSEANVSQPIRVAIFIGFVGGAVLTVIAGFAIGGRLDPLVGEIAGVPRRMPITGWSLSNGDLRVPHFFATHAVQAIPLAALAASALLPSRLAIVAAFAVSAGWFWLTYFTARQALAGKPFLSI